MAVDYDRAYAEVILSRWDRTPDDEKKAAKSRGRGQLAPSNPDSYALHDTWKYQRGHADVFKKVFEEAIRSPLRKGERLLVIDIGAGAATVAVALGEALGRSKRPRVDYLAFDTHPMMRELGTQILGHLDAGFRSAKYLDSFEEVGFAGVDRLLFTLSYVVHQRSVSSDDTGKWAILIKRAVTETDRGVELIYTTAAGLGQGAHENLAKSLKQAGILRRQCPIPAQVQRRGPGFVGSDGQMDWNEQSSLWKVRAEHWTLRR